MTLLINTESIFAATIIGLVTYSRIIYFLVANKKRFPTALFKSKYLLLFVLNVGFSTAAVTLTLLFSNDFHYIGFFFGWALLAFMSLSLAMLIWIFFFMHGYDPRYQFKKVGVPAPMCVIEIILMLSTAVCTFNWPLLGISIAYAITGYLWNYKGYLLTKPKIPDYIPIIEDDEP